MVPVFSLLATATLTVKLASLDWCITDPLPSHTLALMRSRTTTHAQSRSSLQLGAVDVAIIINLRSLYYGTVLQIIIPRLLAIRDVEQMILFLAFFTVTVA